MREVDLTIRNAVMQRTLCAMQLLIRGRRAQTCPIYQAECVMASAAARCWDDCPMLASCNKEACSMGNSYNHALWGETSKQEVRHSSLLLHMTSPHQHRALRRLCNKQCLSPTRTLHKTPKGNSPAPIQTLSQTTARYPTQRSPTTWPGRCGGGRHPTPPRHHHHPLPPPRQHLQPQRPNTCIAAKETVLFL